MLLIVFILFLNLFWPSPAQAKWVACGNQQFDVVTPNLSVLGVNIYYTGTGDVIIEDAEKGEIRRCLPLGLGMRLSGPTVLSFDSGEDIPVLVVTEPGDRRYFDIRDGKQVFIRKTSDGKLEMSSQPVVLPGRKVSILNNWYGASSQIQQTEYLKMTDKFQWDRLWLRHKGPGSVGTKVDFTHNMVVCVFLGQRVNSGGVRLIDAREEESVIVFYFDQMTVRRPGGMTASEPVGFFVMPRSNKKIILKERIPGEGYDPYTWRTVGEI